jgi:beta-lactam-binding protein with PASTA domain
MALTTRVWGAGKVLMLLALLAGTFLVSFLVAMRVAIKTRDVAVPALAGRSVNEATALLTDLGLTLRVEDARRLDPDVPAGRVAAQDPAAGRTTRRQRSVKVWLSGGPASTIVPALVGESERTAQIRLQATALALSGLAEIRSAEYAAGVVIAQTPAADTRAPAVALLLNRGEAGVTYVMPDLIGARGDRAADLMRARGFRVSVVGDHPYPGLPPGTVIRQRPRGGFQVAPGDPISLEVSR